MNYLNVEDRSQMNEQAMDDMLIEEAYGEAERLAMVPGRFAQN